MLKTLQKSLFLFIVFVVFLNPLVASTLTVRTSSSSDAVEERVSDGNINSSSSDLEIGYDSDAQIIGLRFNNITIPRNSTITNAYIQFHADGAVLWNQSSVNFVIYAENADNAAEFSSSDYDVSHRNKTASVNWDGISRWTSDDEAGSDQKTPDLKDIVQTVINRAGWSDGNSFSFSIYRGTDCSSSSCYRRAETHHGDEESPTLVIEYTAAAASPVGCDSSLDTSSNDSSPGVTISDMDGITADQTACVSGSSVSDDKDYYSFTVNTDGTLQMNTSSPNGHEYHFQVQSSINGDIHSYDTGEDRSLSFNLVSGEKITFYSKETGDDTDQWQVDLSFTAGSTGGSGGTTSDADICYNDPYTEAKDGVPISMCTSFGGLNCRNVIPIVNSSGESLTDVNVYLTSDGIMSGDLNGDCGVKDSKGSCTTSSGVEAGPVSALGQNANYDLDDMTATDTDRDTYTESTMGIDFTNKALYSTYIKDGVSYSVEVLPCDMSAVVPKLNVNDAFLPISTSEQTMTFTVDVTPSTVNGDSTFNYHTVDGTAEAGTDYVDVNGTVTIPSGASTVDIDVTINANGEGDFYLILDKPFNAGIEDGNATGSISNALVCQNYDTDKSSSYINIEDLPDVIPDIESAGDVIQSMNHVDENRTACIYGTSKNDHYDYDYYYFQADVDGRLLITTTSPNSEDYGLKITADGGYSYGTEIAQTHTIPAVYLHAGDSVYIRTREDSDSADYEITFNFTTGGYLGGDRPFTIRNPEPTRNIRGNYVIGGNMNLCEDDGNGQCRNSNSNSNSNPDIYIDIDGDSSTYNSTSFDLNISSGSTVVWAGLYWQGVVHKSLSTGDLLGRTVPSDAPLVHTSTKQVDLGDNTYDAEKVKFKIPGASYVEVTADQLDYANLGYAGFTDVTAMLDPTNPNGTYYLADIQCHTGAESNHGNYGAWALVVIYENPDEEYRNVTLFDGYATVDSSYSEDLEIGGFITSSKTPVNSKIAFFAMDGEGGDNYLSVESVKAGTVKKVSGPDNPEDSLFNSTIIGVNNRLANVPSLRLDLDIIDLENYLAPLETQAILRPRTDGDRYTPSFFIMSSTLYIPKFCYDYAYKQNDVYFTEKNDGTKNPNLVGTVSSDPVEMAIYIKNEVDSDIKVENFKLNVLDLNTSQNIYIRESVKITDVDSITAIAVSDSNLTVADDYIKGISIGNIDSNQYFYMYYNLDPQSASLDTPINIEANYDLTLSGEKIPYFLELGSKIELCTDNNFRYQPAKSIFNIVHNDYYNATDSYYNLPTQITNREGNFKVLSLEPDDPDTLVNRSTIVAVEMIDASAFHDTNASCQQLSSSISPKVWVTFDNNVSSTMFDKDRLDNAIANNMTTLTNSFDFYKNARENAAFRITYNAVDNNGSIVQLKNLSSNTYQIANYSELTDGLSVCANDSALTITSQCKLNNSILSQAELTDCMECVYGYRTKFICSRDNFSIRPEAFLVKINDVNQSDTTMKSRLANGVSGNAVNVLETLNLASGYNYNIEINATNFHDNIASPGYTKSFNTTSTIDLIHAEWDPRGNVVTGCNDTADLIYDYRFNDGIIDSDISFDQVGNYNFNMLDSTWTSVDHIDAYMTHHTGEFFKTTKDCVENNNSTQAVNSSTLNGCNINSTHTNSNASSGTLAYADYPLSTHPYYFDISGITTSIGTLESAIGTSSYIYMADMSQDINTSTHFRGVISAKGFNDAIMSNFVDSCYAKPLDINVSRSNYVNNTIAYEYRLKTTKTDGSEVVSINGDLNNTQAPVVIATSAFTKEQNGSTITDLNLNFERTVNNAVNPETITFNSYSVGCSTAADCAMSADLGTKAPAKTNTIAKTVRHYYGRTYAPRQRFKTPSASAFINYEIYCSNGCNKALLPNTINSKYGDDPRWFINASHTSDHGSANVVTQKGLVSITSTAPTGNAPDTVTLTYDETRGYPYKATMQATPSNWLIYNKYNPSATNAEFEVEFINPNSSWAGKHVTDTTTRTTGSATTNRRSMW